MEPLFSAMLLRCVISSARSEDRSPRKSPCERTAATNDRVHERRRLTLGVGVQSRCVKLDHLRIAQLPAELNQLPTPKPMVVAHRHGRKEFLDLVDDLGAGLGVRFGSGEIGER